MTQKSSRRTNTALIWVIVLVLVIVAAAVVAYMLLTGTPGRIFGQFSATQQEITDADCGSTLSGSGGSGTVYYLTSDITCTTTPAFYIGGSSVNSMTLDLAGHTLDTTGAATPEINSVLVLQQGGSITIQDGQIGSDPARAAIDVNHTAPRGAPLEVMTVKVVQADMVGDFEVSNGGASTDITLATNHFMDGAGINTSAVAGSGVVLSLCLDGDDGVGNLFDKGTDPSKLQFGACDDIDGNGQYDDIFATDATVNPTQRYDEGVVTDDLLRTQGNKHIARHGLVKMESETAIAQDVQFASAGIQPEFFSFDQNCDVMAEITEEGAAGCNSQPIKISTMGVAQDTPGYITGGPDEDQGPLVWYDNVASTPSGNATRDDGVATNFNGFYLATSVSPNTAGAGPDAQAMFDDVEWQFSSDEPMQLVCDGTVVGTSGTPGIGTAPSECDVVEVQDTSGNGLAVMEGFLGLQKLPYQNADGKGLDDQKTGVADATAGRVNFTDGSVAAGETHHNADFSKTGKDQLYFAERENTRAFVDLTDTGYSNRTKIEAGLDPAGAIAIRLIRATDDFDHTDYPELGGKARKMGKALAVQLGSRTNGNNPASYTIDPTVLGVTDFAMHSDSGIVFTGGVGGHPTAARSKSPAFTMKSTKMTLGGFATDTYCPDLILDNSTMIPQHVSCTEPWDGLAVGKFGGQTTLLNNTIVPAVHTDSHLSAAAQAVYTNSSKKKGNVVGGGFAYAISNGLDTDEKGSGLGTAGFRAASNTLTDVKGGGIVFEGGDVLVNANTIRMVDDPLGELMTDAIAQEYYYSGSPYGEVPDDQPGIDGQADQPQTHIGGIRQQGGIAVGGHCGRPSVSRDGRNNSAVIANAETDSYGNFIDLMPEGGITEDNCGTVSVFDNNITGAGGSGIAVVTESMPGTACSGPTAPGSSHANACNQMDGYSVAIAGNTLTASGAVRQEQGAPATLPPHTPGDQTGPAFGFDTCISVEAPGIEELEGRSLSSLLQIPVTVSQDNSAAIPANLPRVSIHGNQCGQPNAPSGGVDAHGSLWAKITDNTIVSAYAAIDASIDGRKTGERTLTNDGWNNAGKNYSGLIEVLGNTTTPGLLAHTVTEQQVAEGTEGARNGWRREAASADVFVHADNYSTDLEASGAQQVINVSENTTSLNTIYYDAAGLTGDQQSIESYLDNVAHVFISGNEDANGSPTPIAAANDSDVVPAVDLALAAVETGVAGTVNARCGVRGGGQGNAACNAEIRAYEKTCADSFNGLASDVVANCEVLGQSSTPTSSDDMYSYYGVNVPFDTELYVVAISNDLTDSFGQPLTSNHPSVGPVTTASPTADANLIINRSHPTKVRQQNGSVLYIGEPEAVTFSGPTAQYEFVFESAEQWNVDVCLFVPEGYQVVNAEECQQTLVPATPVSVAFTVQEVGTVPGPASVQYTVTNPEGETSTIESTVLGRMTPELAAEKGVTVDALGYPTGTRVAQATDTTGTSEQSSEPEVIQPAPETIPLGPTNTTPGGRAAEDVTSDMTTRQSIAIIIAVVAVVAIVAVIGVYMATRKKKSS